MPCAADGRFSRPHPNGAAQRGLRHHRDGKDEPRRLSRLCRRSALDEGGFEGHAGPARLCHAGFPRTSRVRLGQERIRPAIARYPHRRADQALPHLVEKLQNALIKSHDLAATTSTGEPNNDGFFGGITGSALKSWQQKNGFPQTGTITNEQWTKLTGEPPPDMFER